MRLPTQVMTVQRFQVTYIYITFRVENIEIICGAIREGVAFMFYPEANVLLTAAIDPESGTPAYKRVPVFVY